MTDFDQNLKRQLEPNELLFNPTVYCDDKMQGIGIGKDFYDINMIEELKFLGQNSPLYRHFSSRHLGKAAGLLSISMPMDCLV